MSKFFNLLQKECFGCIKFIYTVIPILAIFKNSFSAEPSLLQGSTLNPPLPKSLFWVPLVTNCNAQNQFVRGETEPATISIPPGQVTYNVWNFTNVDYMSGSPNLPGEYGKRANPAAFTKLAGFLEKNLNLGLHILAKPEQVQENVDAIQVVPNVPFNPKHPFLATFILPPRYKKTNKYPIVISGNWYSQSNNLRIFHVDSDTTLPGSDDYLVAAGCAMQGRKGVIIVTVNCGGYEAFGIQKEAFGTVADIIDSTVSMFNGDKNKVMFWGRSRGGLTALAWGSNPLGRDYKTIGIFSQSSFPALGTVMSWHTNVLNGFWFAFEKVYGTADILNVPVFNGTDFIYRTTGHESLEEADNWCGLNLLPKLAEMKSCAHITIAIGTKDCWQPYYLGHVYHQRAKMYGLHIRSYFQLGGGHEANIYQVMEDLAKFGGCVSQDSAPEVCAKLLEPTKVYTVYNNPNAGVYGKIKQVFVPKPDSCIPVSVRFPRKMIKGHTSMIEIVGTENRRVKVTLSDSNSTVVINIDTIIPPSSYVLYPFTISEMGKYKWNVVVDPNDTLKFTPFNNLPLVLDVVASVNPSGGYNCGPYYDRGFGVDEVRSDSAYICPEISNVKDFVDFINNEKFKDISAWIMDNKTLFVNTNGIDAHNKLSSIVIFSANGRLMLQLDNFQIRRTGANSWQIRAELNNRLMPGTYLLGLKTKTSIYRHKLINAM